MDQLQTPQQFNQQIVTLLATFPVGSSSGGFTYTFLTYTGPISERTSVDRRVQSLALDDLP